MSLEKSIVDKLILFSIILVLSLTLMYVIYKGNTINSTCNAHWIEQMQHCTCSDFNSVVSNGNTVMPLNLSLNITGDFHGS